MVARLRFQRLMVVSHKPQLSPIFTPRSRSMNFPYTNDAIEMVRHAIGLEMVASVPGEFLTGSPLEEKGRRDFEPQHRVRLTQPFWIGRFPVTQTEYEAVMRENPSMFSGERRPVEMVDWNQAMTFCAKLTESFVFAVSERFVFRLPTDAEWEYACRAGTTSAFNDGSDCTKPWGKDPALTRLGWFDRNSGGKTHPVGEKKPNAWGLHDMHGNVSEWCLDGWREYTWREYTGEAQINPLGPIDEYACCVSRGGSWSSPASFSRAACRFEARPGFRSNHLGFRLAAGHEASATEP